jgi:glycosyltransferase involved in cell wall biosynthesis
MSGRVATNKLRVLTMTDGIVGGGEGLARQISQRLDPERFESTLCATRWQATQSPEEEQALAELAEAGTDFIGMTRSSRFDLGEWRTLLREMRERRIDVLHTHKIGSNFWGAMLAPRVPVPVFIAHEHTWSWEGQPLRRLIDRRLIAPRAAAFLAVSRADQRRMTEIEGIPAEKTRFIPIGIPPPQASNPGADIRAELGIGDDQPLVGAVGTLRPQKAYDVLIRAAAPLRAEFPRVRLVIVGGEESADTTEKPRLEQLVRDLHLEDNVTLLGFRPDSYDLIRGFDVAAMSSNYEGSPQSVLECMEAAKPVVATRVGGIPDMVRDGETGLLVEPQDPEGLASAIAALLRDPDRAEAMGRAGQELRRGEFRIETMVGRLEALYEELYEAAAAADRGGS